MAQKLSKKAVVFSDSFSVQSAERKSDFPRSGTRARSYALLVPGHRKSDFSEFSSRIDCSRCLCFSVSVCLSSSLSRPPSPSCFGALGSQAAARASVSASATTQGLSSQAASQPASQTAASQQASQPASQPPIQPAILRVQTLPQQ